MTLVKEISDVRRIPRCAHRDERGVFFESPFSISAFHRMGGAMNPKRCTLRGLHFRDQAFEETKLVTVVRGSIFDVVVDLRSESATFRRHVTFVLDALSSLYIPRGCAHGYLTLADETDLVYLFDVESPPAYSQRGLRWDDSVLDIEWPHAPELISEADKNWPLLETP